MKKRLLSLLVLLVCAAAGYGVVMQRQPSVTVVYPVRGMAVQAVYATGTVEPTVVIPVSPRAPARLTALLAEEGEAVSKGQVLAQLEDDDLAAEMQQARARADYAEKEFNRQKGLVDTGAVSRDLYERAEAEWIAAEAVASRIAAQMDFLKLRAPEDGLVIRRDGEVGETIVQQQPVFWLSCCAPLRITTEVDEEDVPLVAPGQQVLISADAFSGRIYKGEVQHITPRGDPVSRSYRVRVAIAEETPLMIGMTAETNIIIRERVHALLVPASALDGDRVWTVRDGRAVSLPVGVGVTTLETVEITQGLDTGTFVLQQPPEGIAAGDRVTPVTAPWQAP